MIVDVAVDIGNTRIKWGLCDRSAPRIVHTVSLADDPDAWAAQRFAWQRERLLAADRPAVWVLASVQPHRCERLRLWLAAQGERVEQLQAAAQLPLTVALERPDHVGIDRLLNGVAARGVLRPGEPSILVDAGSAVTVDWLDREHTFCGGAIFPGLRLMAEALHQYTALLPLVRVPLPVPELPATTTTMAMQAGIFWTVVGGIDRVSRQLCRLTPDLPRLFLTGGDAPFLAAALAEMGEEPLTLLRPVLWPEQTLEGIRRAAELLP
jgi:type III pantothenate kinase